MRAAEASVRKFGATMVAVGGGLMNAGLSGVKFGAMLLGPVGLAANAFASFEESLLTTRGSLQARGESGLEESMAALSAEAQRLGLATKFSASDAAQAMAIFVRAGFTAKQAMSATAPALDLAATA